MLVGRGGPVDPADPPDEHQAELMLAASFLAERGIEGEYDLALADPAITSSSWPSSVAPT